MQDPGIQIPYHMLKQARCFTRTTRICEAAIAGECSIITCHEGDDSKRRDHYEAGIQASGTISDCRRKIARTISPPEDERTSFGFDLRRENVWSLMFLTRASGKRDIKEGFRAIIANALFYYTQSGALVVDPLAGGGHDGRRDQHASLLQRPALQDV